MVPRHTSYKAEIKRLKFRTPDGRVLPSTALVTFVVADREKPLLELMGFLDEKEIYEMIDRGEAVNLDHCYVEKFSLKNYRLSRDLDPRQQVVVNNFSARDALFSGIVPLDLSRGDFRGTVFSWENAFISRGDVLFESARFGTSEVSFRNTRFPAGRFSFKNARVIDGTTSFKNCIFGSGEKNFQYASFGNGELSFANTEFNGGDVVFINTDFGKGGVSFKIARFGEGKVDFHYATFREGEVNFERTDFGDGRVDFRTVEFGIGRVSFNRAAFGNGEVSFDRCEMDQGRFSFKRAVFGTGDVTFDEVMLHGIDAGFERTNFGSGKLSFYKSVFRDISLGFCHLNGYVDLRLKECRLIDLSNTVVRDIIDLKPHAFASRTTTLNMAGMRLIGHIYADWKQSGIRHLIRSQGESTPRIRAEQFRILKENFKNLGQYTDEDRAYVDFKREEAKADLADSLQNRRLGALWAYPVHWFKTLLFDKAGLYATSPVRVLLTMAVCFLLFSMVYLFLMLYTGADIVASVDDSLTLVGRSFYHSAITFLTIGYGDHYPHGVIRWVSSLEGFTGLFLMSYFTVAFVRKILR